MSKKTGRQERPTSRPRATRRPRTRIFVATEGEVTEPKYLRDLQTAYRNSAVEVVHGGSRSEPKSCVEFTKEAKVRHSRLAKSDPSFEPFDEYWCVFDVDSHPKLAMALDQAQANDIGVALSNPCFELWGLLHFQNHEAALTSLEAQIALAKHLSIGRRDKSWASQTLIPLTENAISRARRLEERNTNDGETHRNPSTGIWRLVRLIVGDEL